MPRNDSGKESLEIDWKEKMNGRLLDIRVGRANRIQFFLVMVWFFAINFAMFQIQNTPLQYIVLAPSLYIFMVAFVRRVKDTGISKKALLKIVFFVSCLLLTPLIPHVFIVVLSNIYYTMDYKVYILFLAPLSIISYGVALVTSLFCMLGILLYQGTLVENEYGPPPTGLNLKK